MAISRIVFWINFREFSRYRIFMGINFRGFWCWNVRKCDEKWQNHHIFVDFVSWKFSRGLIFGEFTEMIYMQKIRIEYDIGLYCQDSIWYYLLSKGLFRFGFDFFSNVTYYAHINDLRVFKKYLIRLLRYVTSCTIRCYDVN